MPQEIILTSDVPGLGQVGDVKKVRVGYARNFLLPQRMAVLATANAKKKFERQKDKILAARAKALEGAQGVAETIAKVGLVFERTVGPGGRLFGSVTTFDIVSEFAKHGATLEKKSVLIDTPLKSLGDHTIRVRIHSQVVVDVPVKINPVEVKKSAEELEAEKISDEVKMAEVPDDY